MVLEGTIQLDMVRFKLMECMYRRRSDVLVLILVPGEKKGGRGEKLSLYAT